MCLLAISTFLDFSYGFWVASSNKIKAKLFLWLSIINNLGILAIFKYYNFFAEQFKQAFENIGIHTHPVILDIALPIGISFYTFHGMSYVFDIYNGRQKPVANFIEYAVFVSFFPLLVAGPIERATHLLPQVQRPRTFDYNQAVEGCRLILWGMFKKVVIADSLAEIVNNIFMGYQQKNAFALIVAAIAFSFQIYCDFSGYSDIAIGTAKLLGFELLSNFKFPYFSRDIAEFWRRWHISLSSWFKDYLYIPLGGSKNGKWQAIRNVFIIFLVSGFWHGASWKYVAWGFVHACAFLPLLLLGRNRKHISTIIAYDKRWPSFKELIQMGCTFLFVTFAWVFFRADNISVALKYLQRIVVNTFEYPKQFLCLPEGKTALIYIIPFILCEWYLRRDERKLIVPAYKSLVYVILIVIVFFYFGKNNSFIYFQF
ncbi:MAG TPA: MBOAT family O-acyltransferase [Ferruginibacter sp.]|nr:MBOAT family O-acyltransferase [Ferruginibacter sp.]